MTGVQTCALPICPLLEGAAMTFVNEYESVGINMSVEDIIGTPFDEKEGK